MQATEYGLHAEQGADFKLNFTWLIDGVPVDLTGYEASFTIKKTDEAHVDLLVISTEDEIPKITVDDDGNVETTISKIAINGIGHGSYRYYVLLTQPDDITIKLLKGDFIIHP